MAGGAVYQIDTSCRGNRLRNPGHLPDSSRGHDLRGLCPYRCGRGRRDARALGAHLGRRERAPAGRGRAPARRRLGIPAGGDERAPRPPAWSERLLDVSGRRPGSRRAPLVAAPPGQPPRPTARRARIHVLAALMAGIRRAAHLQHRRRRDHTADRDERVPLPRLLHRPAAKRCRRPVARGAGLCAGALLRRVAAPLAGARR